MGRYLEGECHSGGDEWEVIWKESGVAVVMSGKLRGRRV
jgi:hypothetical protein